MHNSKPLWMTLALATLLLFITGCSGDGKVGRVTGTVHLDGKPLEGAMVTFYPQNEGGGMSRGSASMGRTDAQGKYELVYNRSTTGAEIGEHLVYVETMQEGSGYGPGRKEEVPKQYNSESTLRVTVKSGSQAIDFLDLLSEGEKNQERGGRY